MSLLDGLEVRRLWLDVEDNRQTAADLTAAQREAQISAALAVMDAYRPALGPTGVYSAAWFWLPSTYMANSGAFKDRPL